MSSTPVLPVRVTAPSTWQSLPLSQADLGLLFTNSSPFSSTQSLLLIPLSGTASKPLLHAAFGSYTITQVNQDSLWFIFLILTDTFCLWAANILLFLFRWCLKTFLHYPHLWQHRFFLKLLWKRKRGMKGTGLRCECCFIWGVILTKAHVLPFTLLNRLRSRKRPALLRYCLVILKLRQNWFF